MTFFNIFHGGQIKYGKYSGNYRRNILFVNRKDNCASGISGGIRLLGGKC